MTPSSEPRNVPPTPVRAGSRVPRPRRRWGEALRALRILLADKEDTGQVFIIMRALVGPTTMDNYQRLLATREGGRIAYERVELAPKLMDDAWLDTFAPGTVGATYREFVRSERLSAEGLASVSRDIVKDIDLAHPYEWFGRRTRDIHDIWHVLTGYHRDGLGEACLVAFSYAQTRSLGWALIAVGSALRHRRAGDANRSHVKAIWQGYRQGKQAAWLVAEDYERLMAEPLLAARQRLSIQTPTVYDAVPLAERDAHRPEAQPA